MTAEHDSSAFVSSNDKNDVDGIGVWRGLGAFSCLLSFAGIVVYLQETQEGYDWKSQFMSELALGAQGWLMALGFLLLALAIVFHAAAMEKMGFASSTHVIWTRCLFHGAAAAFLGAGLVNLRMDAALHIAFVLLAFILMLLPLFLILRESLRPVPRVGAALAILTVVLALLLAKWQILEPGEGQRLCALGLLGWLAYGETLAFGIRKNRTQRP
ncbi:MAG: DUF998 domain-containing protein [Zoogloeaceae bacterium]|nr:DUF998 domain-containing protein [Zoogloeaceae bacterium]